jgi:acyl-CoA reductase-like NAD-dependent aldehyde dehydrogenase
VLDIVSPHDQSVLGRAARALPADVDRAVAAARDAFDEGPWPRSSPAERIAVIRRLAELRGKRAGEIAVLISAENGSALWCDTRRIIPALLDGKAVVLKVSPENSLSTNLLAQLLAETGLPEVVISVLPADRETSEYWSSTRASTRSPSPAPPGFA